MVPPGEPDGVAGEVARVRLQELLGLAARARAVVAGTGSVRDAARAGQLFRVLIAADTAPGQAGKLIPLLEARRVPFQRVLTRDELGAAIGRGAVAAVGFTNQNLARRAGELVAALPAVGSTTSRGTDPAQG